MLTTVVTVAVLVAVAAADDKLPRTSYVAELYKGAVDQTLNEVLGPYYIPDGQCSGVLDNVLSCSSNDVPAGVRVSVLDTAAFPLVALYDSLDRASVLRMQPCSGDAIVTVRLACPDDANILNATDIF